MGYLIFRGVSTVNLTGVEVSKMPSHRKAAMRNTEYYVKGRDGALHVDEGFENFDLIATLVLINASPNNRQIINAWADGTGKLITSDQPSYAYKASVKDEIIWNRVQGNTGYYDTAMITFNCQPFMYEASETPIELTETTTILNPGSATALPLIKVLGEGDADFTFAGYPIEIADMQPGEAVYIDCENGYVYTDGGATTITGDIPELQMGANTITFGSNVNKIVVTPHWRWV